MERVVQSLLYLFFTTIYINQFCVFLFNAVVFRSICFKNNTNTKAKMKCNENSRHYLLWTQTPEICGYPEVFLILQRGAAKQIQGIWKVKHFSDIASIQQSLNLKMIIYTHYLIYINCSLGKDIQIFCWIKLNIPLVSAQKFTQADTGEKKSDERILLKSVPISVGTRK